MTYIEKLRDPRWQKKRLEVMQRDEFKCQMCGCGDQTLHVHHRVYTRGKEPWEYELDDFITLCVECHENTEWMIQHIKADAQRRDMYELDAIWCEVFHFIHDFGAIEAANAVRKHREFLAAKSAAKTAEGAQ